MFMHEKIISLVQISKIWPSAHSAPIHMPFLHQELLFPVTLDTSKPQDHSANFSLPTRRLSSACPVLLEWLFGSCQIKVHLDLFNCLSCQDTSAPPFLFQLSPLSLIYPFLSQEKYEPPNEPVWVKFHWKVSRRYQTLDYQRRKTTSAYLESG